MARERLSAAGMVPVRLDDTRSERESCRTKAGLARFVYARSSTAISRTITSSTARLAPPVARRSASRCA